REVFAAMCGVRVATVIDIEKGRQMPGGGTLMRLAASLKCRVEDLMPPGYQVTFGPLMVPRERPVESGKQTTRRRKAKESGFAAVAQMVAVSASMLAFLALPGVTKAVTPIIHLM
ncbi:MAG TPA: helix-turn-helix transcriptional regulator, partial [Actinomycetota bacterium]|nr:helix-turn-helix transcriptional regulator [Actinomycetota bacterium]